MIGSVYSLLSKIGYTHPIHPTITHLTIGLVMAAFLFGLTGKVLKNPKFAQTARHCLVLALMALVPTIILGLMDWQHFFKGAWLFPIVMKLVLALMLLILLGYAVRAGAGLSNGRVLSLYGLCFLVVVCLGYFGGELVYGNRSTSGSTENALAQTGAKLFDQSCAICHYPDKVETRVGPGLKGLLKKDTLPMSKWPATEENIRKQLRTPFKNMPAFEDLPDPDIEALVEYLKTL